MSVIAGALGSVIGYLGAEVAEESIFERLLWPQRFYNDFTISVFLKISFLMPMSGPLHAAALATLDKFRDNGLYLGTRRGHMLGTAFYRDLGVKYYLRTEEKQKEIAKESRNGFWVEVLRNVQDGNKKAALPTTDSESGSGKILPYRAMQVVRHLKLRRATKDGPVSGDTVLVTEESTFFKPWLGVFCSELSTIAVAIGTASGRPFKCWWVAGYLCIPLFLKLMSLLVNVRRTSIEHDNSSEDIDNSSADIFEIDDLTHGFAVIQGPKSVVRQFFKHYGHPVRDRKKTFLADRAREVLSMALVYAFVLYFPAGLISLLWMKLNVQYLWLGFQVYTVVVMHIVRIVGWGGCGRTEERIARYLQHGREVFLRCHNGNGVLATLETRDVQTVAQGREEVRCIIENHLIALTQAGKSPIPRTEPESGTALYTSQAAGAALEADTAEITPQPHTQPESGTVLDARGLPQ